MLEEVAGQVGNLETSKFKVLLVWDPIASRDVGWLTVQRDVKVNLSVFQIRNVNLEMLVNSKQTLSLIEPNQEVNYDSKSDQCVVEVHKTLNTSTIKPGDSLKKSLEESELVVSKMDKSKAVSVRSSKRSKGAVLWKVDKDFMEVNKDDETKGPSDEVKYKSLNGQTENSHHTSIFPDLVGGHLDKGSLVEHQHVHLPGVAGKVDKKLQCKRTIFTSQQIAVLEDLFQKTGTGFPGVFAMKEVAARTDLPGFKVSTWFWNRRRRDRKAMKGNSAAKFSHQHSGQGLVAVKLDKPVLSSQSMKMLLENTAGNNVVSGEPPADHSDKNGRRLKSTDKTSLNNTKILGVENQSIEENNNDDTECQVDTKLMNVKKDNLDFSYSALEPGPVSHKRPFDHSLVGTEIDERTVKEIEQLPPDFKIIHHTAKKRSWKIYLAPDGKAFRSISRVRDYLEPASSNYVEENLADTIEFVATQWNCTASGELASGEQQLNFLGVKDFPKTNLYWKRKGNLHRT